MEASQAPNPLRIRTERMTNLPEAPEPPVVLTWPQFQALFLGAHEQGEHVAIVGPSGSGKTMLGLELCKLIATRKAVDGRPTRVVVLNYKPRDETVERLNWPVIKEWPPEYGQEHCVVWPRGGPPSGAALRHRAVFLPLLDIIYQEGGQTVYLPEAAYAERPVPSGMGMGPTMEQFWSTARSLRITMISDTQRPCHVTRLMWSEPAWVFVFLPDDEDDLKRVAQLSGMKMRVWWAARRLGGHEFLCIRRQRDGRRDLYVSRVDPSLVVTRNNRNSSNDDNGTVVTGNRRQWWRRRDA